MSDNKFPNPPLFMAERKRIGMKHVQLKEWLEYLVKTERAKAELRKRLEEELEDGDKVTMENCLIELLEMLKC